MLGRCLEALVSLDHPGYELIVVDNSAGDAEAAAVARRFGARCLVEPRIGLSRARNTGARTASRDVVAFIDDDAVADRGWLRRHTDALADETLAGTTGRVLSLRPASETARAYDSAGGDDLGPAGFRIDRTSADWFERANFGGVGVGGNFALRRALFDGGWGFREDLGMGARVLGEEHYAFFELIRAGHAIAYLPDAVVRHEPPADPELRKRRTLRGSGAYVAMLLVEERGYRRRTLAYALGALPGRRREWRGAAASTAFGSRGERLLAGVCGPAVYVANRLGHGRSRRPAPPRP
jgi:glycosyltransferase involved in cell wall biosynthesis